MFGSKKNKPRKPSGNFDTLISAKTRVDGHMAFSGGLHVDGTVSGSIIAETGSQGLFRLSEAGEVLGDIVAPHVIINGKVTGDVYALEHLELAEKAAITGNVYYKLVQMAAGASVNGNMVHHLDPASLPHPTIKRLEGPSSDGLADTSGAPAEQEEWAEPAGNEGKSENS